MNSLQTRILATLQLLRWPNLILLILIQIVTYREFIAPHGTGTESSARYALWIICFTVTSAAFGYVINDILDTRADQINARNNVLNAGLLSTHFANLLCFLLLIPGIVSAITLSQWSWHFLLLYPFVVFFLWLYSKYLKKMVLLGNIAVSCFCAGAVLMFWYPDMIIDDPQLFLAFGVFAFLLTMVREIVKDIEDIEGDRVVGDRTLPIVYGIRAAKTTGVIFLACTVAGFVAAGIQEGLTFSIASFFWLLALGIMIFIGHRLFVRTGGKEDFHRISKLLKATMAIGMLYFVGS